MRYIVFTDGAGNCEEKKVGCSFCITTNDLYIGSDYKTIDDMDNPTYAETIAVGLAAGYLIDKVQLTPEDTVEFNIDCLSTIEYCRANAITKSDGPVPSPNKKVVISIKLLRKLCGICRVDLFKVKGHKSVTNQNSYVDRLAKLGVRK